MKKVIFIAFSDLHINDWSRFNKDGKRTQDHFQVLSLIKEACLKYGCPALFCGDLFHKPENISPGLLAKTFDEFDKLENYKFKVYAISGNHELNAIVKSGQEKPLSWVSIFSKKYNFLECIDFEYKDLFVSGVNPNVRVFGVPYIDHNIGLNEYLKELDLDPKAKNILLIHTDYPGARDTDGSEVGTSENLNLNVLNRFDLVLCGHIHKPQRLSKKAYMIGAPLQQRRTDKDCDLGYWKVYEDLTLHFVPFDQFPKFIDVPSNEDVKDDGNYYTVIPERVVALESKTNHITKKLSKKRIVKRYLKEKGINDKQKESVLLDIIKESEDD